MRKTVVPRSSRRPRMCSHRLARACGSRPVVGSSRKTSFGHVDQPDDDVEPAPLATGQRLRLPLPQAVEVEARANSFLPALGRLGRAHAVEPGVVDDLLAGAGLGAGGAALRHVADPPADADGVGDQVAAGDGGRAGGGLEQGGQHPQRRRLAGPVGAEEADDLPGVDVEVDADDGVHFLLASCGRCGRARGRGSRGTASARVLTAVEHIRSGRSDQCRPSPRSGRRTAATPRCRCERAGAARAAEEGAPPARGRWDAGGAARTAPRAPGRGAPATAARGRRPTAGRRAGGRRARPPSRGSSTRAARGSRASPRSVRRRAARRSRPAASAARRAAGRSGRRPTGRPGGRPASATAGRSPRRRWRCRRATAGR